MTNKSEKCLIIVHKIVQNVLFANLQTVDNQSANCRWLRIAVEDKKLKERVESRNELESYAYSLKNQINDKEKLGAKITDEDKEKIEEAVNEKISWLEENQEADGEDFKAQKKELEEIVQPIIAKLYQQGGGPPPGGEPEEEDFDKDEL